MYCDSCGSHDVETHPTEGWMVQCNDCGYEPWILDTRDNTFGQFEVNETYVSGHVNWNLVGDDQYKVWVWLAPTEIRMCHGHNLYVTGRDLLREMVNRRNYPRPITTQAEGRVFAVPLYEELDRCMSEVRGHSMCRVVDNYLAWLRGDISGSYVVHNLKNARRLSEKYPNG